MLSFCNFTITIWFLKNIITFNITIAIWFLKNIINFVLFISRDRIFFNTKPGTLYTKIFQKDFARSILLSFCNITIRLWILKNIFRNRSKSVSTQKPGNLITFSAKYKINQKWILQNTKTNLLPKQNTKKIKNISF